MKSGKFCLVLIDEELVKDLCVYYKEYGKLNCVFGFVWVVFWEGIEWVKINFLDG